MEFKSEIQKACYEKILPWMKEIFGENARPDSELPYFRVRSGSALAYVQVDPWVDGLGEESAIIWAYAFVVRGAEPTPELMRDLLEKNANRIFGAFGLQEDNSIVFAHSVVGPSCDKDELRACVRTVAETSDRYDDELIAKYGGQKAIE